MEVEVAVVGGGMAGVSVAAELSTTHSVALLEQEEQLAYHATGRSAAAFLETYGSPEVRALTRASRKWLERAEAEGGAGLLSPRPLLWVAGAGQEGSLDELVAARLTLRRLEPTDARAMCPALRADRLVGAAVEPDAQDIDVAAMHQMYVAGARRAGATILRASRLRAAVWVPAAERWELRHASGELRAGVVVNAAGAWADPVALLFGAQPRGLRPLRRTIAVARTDWGGIGRWPLVADVDERFYFRPEGPHLLVSLADETPSDPCDARPDEADVALALERVNEATTLGLRSVVTTWAGLRTFAPDRNPVVGFDPDVPGLFWLAGQGGYGIQTAPALAHLAAALIRGAPPVTATPPDLDLDQLSPTRLLPP